MYKVFKNIHGLDLIFEIDSPTYADLRGYQKVRLQLNRKLYYEVTILLKATIENVVENTFCPATEQELELIQEMLNQDYKWFSSLNLNGWQRPIAVDLVKY